MTSITELLFHTPWWFPVLIFAVGGFVFVSGNKRQEPRTRLAGFVFMLIAVALVGVSYMVDTDLEKAVKRSREAVAAIEARDWTKFETLLDKNCTLKVLNAITLYRNRTNITDAAKIAVDRYGLKAAHILSIDGEETGGLIIVDFNALTEHDSIGQPIPSTWQFEWSKINGEWVLTQIINVKVANQTGDNAATNFPRPK